MLYLLHGLTFLVIEVAWVQLRILLMGIQNGVYQQENHLGVLKTLGIKFQMPLKALLMLDIQNMKVSKGLSFLAQVYNFFWQGNRYCMYRACWLLLDFYQELVRIVHLYSDFLSCWIFRKFCRIVNGKAILSNKLFFRWTLFCWKSQHCMHCSIRQFL